MAERTGLATAVIEAGGIGDLGLDGDQQLGMFEADAPMPMESRGISGPKGGRPKGARNKSTEEWREYLLGRYRSPLVVLMELYSRTPQELAKELGLYVINEGELVKDVNGDPMLATGEAFKRQLEAAIAALPYLHQKQPIAIEASGKSAGMLVIGHIEGVANGDDGTIVVSFEQPQSNQRVINATDIQSDDVQSDEPTKPLKANDDPASAP